MPLGTIKGRMRLGLEKMRTSMDEAIRMNVADEYSRWDEDLAAFAVGALDSEETVAFADHLARCDRCRGEPHQARAGGGRSCCRRRSSS